MFLCFVKLYCFAVKENSSLKSTTILKNLNFKKKSYEFKQICLCFFAL